MINFTVGPVQMSPEIRKIGKNQIPYFRTSEFSELMLENEKLLCTFFDAPENSRCIFMTGSGTASMEASVMNLFTKEDKLLVINGGSFGHRLVEICQIHEIPYEEIKLDFGVQLSASDLNKYASSGFTGLLVQLCETSTGIKYNLKMIGEFCKANNIFLFVDAISGFLADEFSMKEMNVNAAITGSQKALALPPSLSFIILDERAVNRCNENNVKSLYFNLKDYLKNGERGQTPFTPAVGTLIQLNKRLNSISKNGGVKTEIQRTKELAEYFRNEIVKLPFKLFISSENASNCVTTLTPANKSTSAYDIFTLLKDEYKIWICPNGGELKDKVFRVGHIGFITKKEINKLIKCLKNMNTKGLL